MSDTTYVDYTIPAVNAEWLNEVNDHVWHDTNVTGKTAVHDSLNIKNTPSGNIASTNIQDAINELDTEKVSLSDLASSAVGKGADLVGDSIRASKLASTDSDKGSELIGFKQSGTGTVNRTVRTKLQDIVNLKDFGAVGDGVTDDTNAISSAISYITSTGHDVEITPGTYLTDPFVINSQTYAGQANFVGTDRERCIIRRKSTGVSTFVTYGSVTGTVFQSGVGFKNLTFDGGVTTNGDTFVGYDIVRSTFTNVRFTGGSIACHLYGGISLTFYSCLFDMATIGLKIEKFTSLAGGGWPNLIRVIDGEIVDNTIWGTYFDYGRVFILENVEVENNGTTLAAAQGGVYIGSSVGSEVSVTDTYSIGLIATGCWFEANKGVADISLNNGINTIRDSNFFSTAAMVTNDIVINGGRYSLRNVNMSMSKTANVLENAGSVAGNIVESSDIPNITFTASKTSIYGNNKISTRNGVVPVVTGLSIPYEQNGTATSSAGTTITVTFPVAYNTAPFIYTEVNNGDTATDIIKIVVSSITTTGFTARALRITNGSSTISSISAGFFWRAIGTL